MATIETSATDSKIIIKNTTEQNKTDSRDEHMKSRYYFTLGPPYVTQNG